MRVLLLTQFYPPESGAPQNRLGDLARRFAAAGHGVEVLTAMPNYPKGIVFEGYRHRAVLEEERDGIKVIRTWIFAGGKGGFLRRLSSYWSFVVTSLVFGLRRIRRPDVVIVEMPPLFLGISAYVISRWLKTRLAVNVSDLWPQSAVSMGILQNRFLIGASTGLEEFLYRKADLITGQTEGIVENIRSRFPDKTVGLITNGVDTRAFAGSRCASGKAVRQEFGFADRFVVGYAGLHGLAQGLDSVIRAARAMAAHPEILVVFFGDGPLKQELATLAGGAENVRFLPAQLASRMPEILSSFDVAVIPLKRLDLFRGALPSKMFEAMAAGVPLVVAIEGEAQALVERSQAGICVEPENSQAMADAVIALRNDPEARRTMGENGRRYVTEHYDRAKIAGKFEKLLVNAVTGGAKPVLGDPPGYAPGRRDPSSVSEAGRPDRPL